eukprot:GILJ01014492.1.p1 GENE.GILJ01014492.1~~GILJ01014492.1.p1  ORF type:complete len:186 (+),score=18.32 GILJ01014492.1:3-560(+)
MRRDFSIILPILCSFIDGWALFLFIQAWRSTFDVFMWQWIPGVINRMCEWFFYMCVDSTLPSFFSTLQVCLNLVATVLISVGTSQSADIIAAVATMSLIVFEVSVTILNWPILSHMSWSSIIAAWRKRMAASRSVPSPEPENEPTQSLQTVTVQTEPPSSVQQSSPTPKSCAHNDARHFSDMNSV